jgi:hypothetical protein
VNRIVVPLDEFWQYIYVSERIFIRHISVQLIANCAMASSDYSTFHIRFSIYLKLNTFFLQHVLERFVQKLFVPICSHPDSPSVCIFCEDRAKSEATAVHVFALNDTI